MVIHIEDFGDYVNFFYRALNPTLCYTVFCLEELLNL